MRVRGPNMPLVLKQLTELKPEIIEAGARGLAVGLDGVIAMAYRFYLKGPRPLRLGEVTGRLSKSLTRQIAIVPGKGAVGRVGTNVRYAAYHEFGYRGAMRVGAHTRVVSQEGEVDLDIDTRRQVRERGQFFGYRDTRKKAQSKGLVQNNIQFVRAHTRNMNYPGRPFIAPAMERSRTIILDLINRELEKVQPKQPPTLPN